MTRDQFPRGPVCGRGERPTAEEARRLPERAPLRTTPLLARLIVGIAGATAMTGAGLMLFGPFSDLSALQLAAGPQATEASGAQPAAIVLARTGRSWAETARAQQVAAASAPLARVARREAKEANGAP